MKSKKELLLDPAVFTFNHSGARNLGFKVKISDGRIYRSVRNDDRFRQIETFVDLDLPWRWDFQPGFDSSAVSELPFLRKNSAPEMLLPDAR